MKNIYLFLFVSIFSACTATREVNDDGDKAGHTIYCSGSAYSWDTCDEKASEMCGDRGYDVLDKYEDKGAFVAYGSSRVLPDRRLIIQCKE